MSSSRKKASSSRVHSHYTPSLHEQLGSKGFLVAAFLLCIALYYYIFVYHATLVYGETTALDMEKLGDVKVKANKPKPLEHPQVIQLKRVPSEQSIRIKQGLPVEKLPHSVVDQSVSVYDIMRHAGQDEVSCRCLEEDTAATILHSAGSDYVSVAKQLASHPKSFSFKLADARKKFKSERAIPEKKRFEKGGYTAFESLKSRVVEYNAAAARASQADKNEGQENVHDLEKNIEADLKALHAADEAKPIVALELESELQDGEEMDIESQDDAFPAQASDRTVDSLVNEFQLMFADELSASN